MSSRPVLSRPAPWALLSAAVVAAGFLVGVPQSAEAAPAATAPVAAAAGAGPVTRALPLNALPHHGRPAGQRAVATAPKAPTKTWTPATRPTAAVASSPTAAAAHAGATDIYGAPGDVLGTTSWIVYFNIPEPWTTIGFSLYDAATNQRITAPGATQPPPYCGQRTVYCISIQTLNGWPIVDGHSYYATVTVYYSDNTSVTSAPSNSAPAHLTPLPPGLPLGQTLGCVCPTSAGRTTGLQGMSGDPVNTATGAYSETATDLRMAVYGVPFSLTRTYTSTDTSAGMLGPGWNVSVDMRLVLGTGTATFRAEDGSETVFTQSGTTWVTPPGARATLSTVTGGYELRTPTQERLRFDSAGLLTAVLDRRGSGLGFAYTAGALSSITDAAGRAVTVTTSGGRITKVTLPDGRYVQYTYTSGRLTAFRDAAGGTTAYGYDAGGRLATVTDPNGHLDVENTYDPVSGRVTKQTDALGKITQYAWNATYQEATVTDPDGVVTWHGYRNNVLVYSQNGNFDLTEYRYDSRLRLATVIDPLGNRFPLSYDANGNVTGRPAPATLGWAEADTHDGQNNLTSHRDGRSNTTTLTYDSYGGVLTETDRENNVTIYTYNSFGLVATRKDALEKTTVYGYDAQGNLTSETTPLGRITTHTYDGTGRRTSTVDPRGNVTGADPDTFRTRFGYDGLDRVTSTTDPLQHVRTSTYDPAGNLKTTVDAELKTTTYDYDLADHLVTVTDRRGKATTTVWTPGGRRKSVTTPTGDLTTYAYDAAGRLRTVTAPRGNATGAVPADHTTTYGYDWNGNRVRESHPYPGGGTAVTTTTYDELNRPVTVTDPLGRVTKTEYDPQGNVTAEVDGLGRRTTHTYDKEDRRTSTRDPRGKVTGFGYDKVGRNLSETTPLGFKTTWGYDADGRLGSTVDPRGNVAGGTPATYTTRYGYDVAGNRLSVTDPLTNVTRYTYDAANNVASTTDANTKVTRYRYDSEDRVTWVRGPDASTDAQASTYTYDAEGNLLTRTDPLSRTTTSTYDDSGRLQSVTDGLNRTETYGYDPDGNRTTVVTARGTGAGQPGGAPTQAAGTITDTYDILGRRTARSLGTGPSHTWGYNSANQRTSSTDAGGTETREYNDAGQLKAVVRGTDRIDYTFDTGGNLQTRRWNGVTATLTYDDDTRVAAVAAEGGTTTFGYDVAGNLTTTTLPATNGYTETRTFDPAGRISRVATTRATAPPALTLAAYDLTFDPVGNPTQVVANRPGTTRTDTYTYDAANRVTAQCYDTATCTGATTAIRYAYNLAGDRTTETRTGVTAPGTTTYTYDGAAQLTSTTGAVAATYTYDRDGNQLTAGADTFTYDLADRTTSATVGGTTTTYTHDADGNRATSATGGTTTSYRWDLSGSLPMLAVEKTGTTARSFRYDPESGPLSMTVTGAGTHFLTSDWLGSVSDMTAVGGTREYAYTYEPFGAGPDPAPLTPSAPANPIRFTGEYRDARSGLYNLRARQYAPGLGRFTSVDPVAAPLTDPAVGPYVYAADRATVWTDPTGEFPCPFGRNPDGGCRGGNAARTAGEAARGAGAAARDFALGLAAPAPVRGQRIIDGAKASLADCYTGLTTATNPAAGCLANVSGLTQVMQGLALAFDGCVYVGAYQATGGAIQLFLTLAPLRAGQGLRPTRLGPDLPYPPVVAGELATLHGAERLAKEGFDQAAVAATRAGRLLRQADGARVYVNEVSPGRYDFIVIGDRGVITAHRGWSFKSVSRLAKNYGWIGWP